jgi:hypothetical protein
MRLGAHNDPMRRWLNVLVLMFGMIGVVIIFFGGRRNHHSKRWLLAPPSTGHYQITAGKLLGDSTQRRLR